MSSLPYAKKSLGQHWLQDEQVLKGIVQAVAPVSSDTVLEVGPGPGALTHILLQTKANVVAVELDDVLAKDLAKKFHKYKNFSLQQQNILSFNYDSLPANYKIAANIPYYLTAHLMKQIMEATNKPLRAAFLVQKEVAERICARPGQLSVIAVGMQLYFECSLGEVVPAALFTPPPKVDSQVLILKRRDVPLQQVNEDLFFKALKAGFSQKRKKIKTSLAGGLGLSSEQTLGLLQKCNINPEARAQELTVKDWATLSKQIKVNN